MPTPDTRATSEQESRRVAEQARAEVWEGRGFLRELFLGNFPLDLIHPYPAAGARSGPSSPPSTTPSRTSCATTWTRWRSTPPASIPEHVVDGLRKLGAFGMKIPKEYGGLGFTNVEYQKVMQLLGSIDGNLVGAALGAPVDRRAAAAQAVRHATR